MPTCAGVVGVKNIMIAFRNCSTDEVLGPLKHEHTGDDLPMIRMCTETYEPLTGGYSKKVKNNAQMEFNVIYNRRVPLSYYQGCATVDVSIEYEDGQVFSGVNGTITGEDGADGHEVSLTVIFREIDQLLANVLLDEAA